MQDPSEAAREAFLAASASPGKNGEDKNKESDLDSVAAVLPPPPAAKNNATAAALALARAKAAAAAANDDTEVSSFAAPCGNDVRGGPSHSVMSFGATTLGLSCQPPSAAAALSASALPRGNANAAAAALSHFAASAAMPQVSENSVWQPQGGEAKGNKNKNKEARMLPRLR